MHLAKWMHALEQVKISKMYQIPDFHERHLTKCHTSALSQVITHTDYIVISCPHSFTGSDCLHVLSYLSMLVKGEHCKVNWETLIVTKAVQVPLLGVNIWKLKRGEYGKNLHALSYLSILVKR